MGYREYSSAKSKNWNRKERRGTRRKNQVIVNLFLYLLPRLAEDHSYPIAPILIDTEQSAIYVRRHKLQQRVRCRMNLQSGRHKQEQRWLGREFAAGEVSELLEF